MYIVLPFRNSNINSYIPETKSTDCIINKEGNLQELSKLRIVTFNCKNLRNGSECIADMLKDADLCCLQEHWLYNFEQNTLYDIIHNVEWSCKSVDDDNPIPPTQRPRGYGGVAILWNKTIDHLMERLNEGSNRITCIRVNVQPAPILLTSIYMPCRGTKASDDLFMECLDQLRSIWEKYSPNHFVITCGDWNCDISKAHEANFKPDKRQKMLLKFVQETNMWYQPTEPTFIHPNGRECSTIDYIFLQNEYVTTHQKVDRLDMLPNNTSDHYPLRTAVDCLFELKVVDNSKVLSSSKINWQKVNLIEYQSTLNEKLETLDLDSECVDTTLLSLSGMLKSAQEMVSTKKAATKQKKQAHLER